MYYGFFFPASKVPQTATCFSSTHHAYTIHYLYTYVNSHAGKPCTCARATHSNSGKRDEKSGSVALTSVKMSVTLSLKVCQQTDQAAKPELSWECNPTNKDVDGQLVLSAPHQACLTLSGKSAPWHELEQVYQTKQMHRFKIFNCIGSVPVAVCLSKWSSSSPPLFLLLPGPSQAHSWNTVL